jgi:hypothetical protein
VNSYTVQRLYRGTEKIREQLHGQYCIVVQLTSPVNKARAFDFSPPAILDQTGYNIYHNTLATKIVDGRLPTVFILKLLPTQRQIFLTFSPLHCLQ